MLVSDEVSEGMQVVCPECGAEIECHPYVAKVNLSECKNSPRAASNE